jgi:hypothetical protein
MQADLKNRKAAFDGCRKTVYAKNLIAILSRQIKWHWITISEILLKEDAAAC